MLNSAALPTANRPAQLSTLHRRSDRPDYTSALTAVALTTNWVSDVEEINKLLSDGVLVLLTPSGSLAAVHTAADHASGQQRQQPVTGTRQPDIVRVAQLEIDLGEHSVRWQGSCLDLSEREIAILACLGQDVGRAYSFADLFRRAWGSSCHIDALVIHSAVQRIRRKFAAASVPVTIESVRGYGFRIASARRAVANASLRLRRDVGCHAEAARI